MLIYLYTVEVWWLSHFCTMLCKITNTCTHLLIVLCQRTLNSAIMFLNSLASYCANSLMRFFPLHYVICCTMLCAITYTIKSTHLLTVLWQRSFNSAIIPKLAGFALWEFLNEILSIALCYVWLPIHVLTCRQCCASAHWTRSWYSSTRWLRTVRIPEWDSPHTGSQQ